MRHSHRPGLSGDFDSFPTHGRGYRLTRGRPTSVRYARGQPQHEKDQEMSSNVCAHGSISYTFRISPNAAG
jgi:hypothetical protein